MVFLKFHAEFHMDGLQWGIRTWMMRTDASTWEGHGGFGGFLKKTSKSGARRTSGDPAHAADRLLRNRLSRCSHVM